MEYLFLFFFAFKCIKWFARVYSIIYVTGYWTAGMTKSSANRILQWKTWPFYISYVPLPFFTLSLFCLLRFTHIYVCASEFKSFNFIYWLYYLFVRQLINLSFTLLLFDFPLHKGNLCHAVFFLVLWLLSNHFFDQIVLSICVFSGIFLTHMQYSLYFFTYK